MLAERDDTYEGKPEIFCYDSLNRLTNTSTGSSCTTGTRTYLVYSPNGNIQRKSDVCTASACMTYGSGAGPHALTAITGTVDGIVNPTFTYDANGNMTAGLGRSYSWTSYNMAASISQGTATVGWTYSPDRLRLKMCVGGCTSPSSTTLYLRGPAYSEKVTAGAATTWTDTVAADGQIVATRTLSGGTATFHYMVADHLGSTSVVTDAGGAVVERDSYDAWGKRRNPDFTADPTCSLTSTTTRGFTGQEHVDALCLENFNARMYDPLLARFSSADSVVADGYDGQSFNRYAYAEGNPLNAIDPSGHALVGCTGGQKFCVPDDAKGAEDAPNPPPIDAGLPCYGCWGSGETTSDGNVISVELLSWGTFTYQDKAGNYLGSYTGTIQGLIGDLYGMGMQNYNNGFGFGTQFRLELPGMPLTTINFALGCPCSTVGEGGMDGATSHALSVFDGMNAGFSHNAGTRLTLQQMNEDITAFRNSATAYYLKSSDTDDKDLGIDTFKGSLTYKWTQFQSNPAINQLGNKLIDDIALDPWPAWPLWFGNPTLEDIDKLTAYVKGQ